MVTRIGINGFGRIGRNILRAFFEEAPKGLDIVAINDLSPIEASAFLLEHDTSHGHLGFDVKVKIVELYLNTEQFIIAVWIPKLYRLGRLWCRHCF